MKRTTDNRDSALVAAIVAANGVAALAKRLGIRPQSISGWDRTPAHRVIAVERVSGIPRHQLRPDLYPEHEAA